MQHGDAERLEDLRAGVAAANERGVDVEGALEFLSSRQQQRAVIADHCLKLGGVANAQLLCSVQVLERRCEFLQLELAQSPEGPCRPVRRLVLDDAREGVAAFAVAISVVVDGPERPVAFRPRRLQGERLLIEGHGMRRCGRLRARPRLDAERVEGQPSSALELVADVGWDREAGTREDQSAHATQRTRKTPAEIDVSAGAPVSSCQPGARSPL